MSTITFDTHKFVRKPKASGIDEHQAEAITKPDLREMRAEINAELHLLKWMVGFLMAMNSAIFVRLFIK